MLETLGDYHILGINTLNRYQIWARRGKVEGVRNVRSTKHWREMSELDWYTSANKYSRLYTLYCPKFWDSPSNHWHVYKIKQLGMQTASKNNIKRMGCSQELSEFKHGAVICCLLCNMSIHEIASLLNIPWSTVSGIITKKNQFGTIATQPQNGRPYKIRF